MAMMDPQLYAYQQAQLLGLQGKNPGPTDITKPGQYVPTAGVDPSLLGHSVQTPGALGSGSWNNGAAAMQAMYNTQHPDQPIVPGMQPPHPADVVVPGVGGGSSAMKQPGSSGSQGIGTNTGGQSGGLDYGQLLAGSQSAQSFRPMMYQDFGNVPYMTAATADAAHMQSPTGMHAASVDQSTMPGALDRYIQQLQTSLSPAFEQQRQQQEADLASRGIFNSSAASQAYGNLQGQQASALSQGVMPLITQFSDAYNQNNQLNAQMQQQANQANYGGDLTTNSTNAQFQQQSNQANQAALNNQNQYNSMLYGGIVNNNMNAQNAYLSGLQTTDNAQKAALLNGALASYDPHNTGAAQILASGVSSAGNAYANAYNAAGQNSGSFVNALGQLGTQLGNSLVSQPSTTAGNYQAGTYNTSPMNYTYTQPNQQVDYSGSISGGNGKVDYAGLNDVLKF